jgi:hypothetical protein
LAEKQLTTSFLEGGYDRGVLQFTRILLSSEHLRVVYRPVRDGQLQDTITGEGIAGPYRLSRSPIIPNSETVLRVDRLNRSIPLVRDDTYQMYEYACHEGNYAMANSLSFGRKRDAEEAAAKAASKPSTK